MEEKPTHTIEVTKNSLHKPPKTQPVKITDFNIPFSSMDTEIQNFFIFPSYRII